MKDRSLPHSPKPDAEQPDVSGQPRSNESPSTPQAASSRWRKLLVGIQIVQVRLRFIALLVALGVVIGNWETLRNYWDKWTRPRHSVTAAITGASEYYCPMHPHVVRSEPGNCPICGMPLSKRAKGEAGKVQLPKGVLSRKQYAPYRIEQGGIQTSEVAYRPLVKEIETVGYVTYDDTRRSRIVTRAAGYIEKLYVDQSWVVVENGAPLAEIYSPELYSAARELLIATQRGRTDSLADAARQKLRLLGITAEQIDMIEQTRRADETLLIRSPQHGHVVEKNVLQGQHVEAGQTLYEVADLRVVWIEAEVFEKDIALLHEGCEVEAKTEAFPGRVFHGKVQLILRRVNPNTRTNTVRLEIENSDHDLRPGMYVTVRIRVPLIHTEPYKSLAANQEREALVRFISTANSAGSQGDPKAEILSVPASAVIDTGAEKVVYVEREGGVFDGVAVVLGARTGDFYPVINGLKPGQRVATAGAFLLDAETRLNPAAAASYFGATDPTQSDERSAPSAEPGAPSPEDSAMPVSSDIAVNLNELSEGDRRLATAQRLCPVTGSVLGSMGTPYRLSVKGSTVFLCCSGCKQKALRHPDEVLRKVASGGNPREGTNHD